MTHSQKELIPLTNGERLQQRRVARKLSLAQIASAICHDESVLREIEEDRADHIAAIYRRGYIRAYAHFLAFTEVEIQHMLQVENDRMVLQEPPVQSIFSKPAKRKPADRWLHVTSYVLASMLIGTLAWQFSREAVRLSQTGEYPGEHPNSMPVTQTLADQKKTADGPVNASIAPLGVLHAGQSGNMDPAERAWTAISQPQLPEGISRLRVSVSADSWVEITDADGQSLEMDLIRAGNEKTYQGRGPFRILLGQASAVRLFVDGERVDVMPFARDDVARLTWPGSISRDDHRVGQD